MRLLEHRDGKISLTKDLVRDIPRYAILSHTWGPDTEEVTFKDLVDGTGENKTGYEKIRFCARQASRDGLQHFWVDTCCIDKSNNTELSTAINSMFRWYQDAARCYVYLSDVSASSKEEDGQQSEFAWESAFRASKWFTRGWTLQELLAPASVEFFTTTGQRLGDKRSLEQQIHEITGIAVLALRGSALAQFDVEERFTWAETRQTTHEEDWAYCLLGVFDVFMPLIYGEGQAHAVRRLKKEIAEARDRRDTPNHQGGIQPICLSSTSTNYSQAQNRTWMVPFERNGSFTGRESELMQLRKELSTEHQTAKVAITGLGGVGKTQLALEWAYRTRAENSSVIWIPATSKESLEQAFLNAAKQLGIPGWDDDKADVKRLVRDHLSSESAGRWLLVFDNADDVSMWVEKSAPESSRLIDNLPKSLRGSILFTTRDKKTAVKLAGRKVVEISEMDEVGSKQLLRNYLLDQDLLNSQGAATALLTWLTHLPLAIVQAAMYINENGIGLGDYLSLLEEQEVDVIDLLSEDFEDEWRYDNINNPVATTWLISFNQVQQRDPLAADYLSFMACVDPKDIPQSLLPPGPSKKKVTDAMGMLQGYSFIAKQSGDSTDSTINIHRLVHLATRNWLQKEGLLPGWTSRVIARLEELLSKADGDDRVVWRSYLPHAYYTLASGLGVEDSEDTACLLYGYGRCLDFDGRYNEAEASYKRAIGIFKTKLGADHPATLSSMGSLAAIYQRQGRWQEAEKLNMQVLEKCKVKLGADHPDTLLTMGNLAMVYMDQGHWEEAEKLIVQALETHKIKLRADHPATLLVMGNLAALYERQGRWQEAEKLNIQVLENRKVKLGADHPDTLSSMNNLAALYERQGRWQEAEKLNMQVLEKCKVKLGADHPNTLSSMSNLAIVYMDQGHWEEAEKLIMQALETRKIKLGADHPDTLVSMNNVAVTWNFQGRHSDALALMKDCVLARQRILGPEHPETLSSMALLERWS